MTRPTPRWRCGYPDCWAYRWQVLRMWRGDPVDAAVGELERHYGKEHRDEGDGS